MAKDQIRQKCPKCGTQYSHKRGQKPQCPRCSLAAAPVVHLPSPQGRTEALVE